MQKKDMQWSGIMNTSPPWLILKQHRLWNEAGDRGGRLQGGHPLNSGRGDEDGSMGGVESGVLDDDDSSPGESDKREHVELGERAVQVDEACVVAHVAFGPTRHAHSSQEQRDPRSSGDDERELEEAALEDDVGSDAVHLHSLCQQ